MMNVSVRMEDQKLLEQRITDMKNKVNCSEHELISDEDPFYSAENQKRLERSIRHAKEGKLTEHKLIEA